MWSILNGTVVNAVAVAAGSTVGLVLGARIPDRHQRIILTCLGLVTIILGVDAAVMVMAALVRKFGAGIPTYGARVAMVAVGSLIIGAVLGTALRLHERLENLGRTIHGRFGGGDPAGGASSRFAEGFLSASVIFCVGPLTLLGCLRNGVDADPSYLYIKSSLDAFCSMALAASLGWGVACSVLTILVFQGGLAISAHYFADGVPELSVQLMNVVGGFVLIATAMTLLELKKIPVANLLPGIFLPPIAVWLVEAISRGALMPGRG
ncbi:MAG: DUF554 domain-containing protein [Phycisphaerae bacterium]